MNTETLLDEYLSLRDQCEEFGCPIDLISDRIWHRWDDMSDRGRRIHLEKAIKTYKVLLSVIDPSVCPVCGRPFKR